MLELETTEWLDWFERITEAVKQMDDLMESKYSIIIRDATTPLVPLKTGRLMGGFITELSSTFPVSEELFGYFAMDPETFEFYAEYQHDVVPTEAHPIQGEQFFLIKGIARSSAEVFTEIEEDYLSCFHV